MVSYRVRGWNCSRYGWWWCPGLGWSWQTCICTRLLSLSFCRSSSLNLSPHSRSTNLVAIFYAMLRHAWSLHFPIPATPLVFGESGFFQFLQCKTCHSLSKEFGRSHPWCHGGLSLAQYCSRGSKEFYLTWNRLVFLFWYRFSWFFHWHLWQKECELLLLVLICPC